MKEPKTATFNLKIIVAPNLYKDDGSFYCKCYPIDEKGKFERKWGTDEIFGTGSTQEEAMKDCMKIVAEKLEMGS